MPFRYTYDKINNKYSMVIKTKEEVKKEIEEDGRHEHVIFHEQIQFLKKYICQLYKNKRFNKILELEDEYCIFGLVLYPDGPGNYALFYNGSYIDEYPWFKNL
jgi:hypothetical protein